MKRGAMDLHQEQPPRYKIQVKMVKTVALDVKSTDTVDQIKSKISAIEGIDKSQQALFFGGNHLENKNRLADYNIMTNSSVDLYVTDGIQISVSIPSVGKVIKLNLKKSQSVADVKSEIEQKVGIPLDEQILMYGCRQLEDNKQLSQCGLRNGHTLHVLVCPTDKLRISARSLILMRTQPGGAETLPDTETLQNQHIRNNDTLMLHQNIQFFVKTYEGKSLTMSMRTCDTTDKVMEKVEAKLMMKAGVYYLHYRGHVMSPGDALQKHKVANNSTVDIRLRNSSVVSKYAKAK